MNQYKFAFQRMPEFMDQLGYHRGVSPSSVYRKIDDGLLPPPCKLYGERASVFLVHETTIVIAARAIGKTGKSVV